MYADAIDGEGHGTHCAGSALGGLANGAHPSHSRFTDFAVLLTQRLAGMQAWSRAWLTVRSSCAGALSNWQGMAPGAKIAFQDLGSDNTGTLSVPYDLFYDYFPYNYQWCLPS